MVAQWTLPRNREAERAVLQVASDETVEVFRQHEIFLVAGYERFYIRLMRIQKAVMGEGE